MNTKVETRIIPEETDAKFYAEHLKPYEFLKSACTGKKVLEIGCGDGYGSAYLAKTAVEVVGTDYQQNIVLHAQNKYKSANLSYLPMDATCLKFQDNTFDVVCSFQVIEHIPEDKLLQYLSEIKRVLKEGGKAYISTLNLEHNMKSPLTYRKHPAHCKEFKITEFKDLLFKIFGKIEFYGLHLTLKHSFYQRLKKSGLFKSLPGKLNPVNKFYMKVAVSDFKITSSNLRKAIDFICICNK